MNIILFRHGDAENSSPGVKDSERKLTATGEVRTRKNAELLKQYIGSPDYILTSPLARAQQTAKIILEVLHCKNEIITDKKLAPGSKSENIIDLANYLNAQNILFVGHQPDLSNQLSGLISPTEAYVEFKKSAAAKISFGKKPALGKGVLELLLPPVPEK